MRKTILIGGFASLLVVALAEETHPQYQGWMKSMPSSVIRPPSSKLQHFRMKLTNAESYKGHEVTKLLVARFNRYDR